MAFISNQYKKCTRTNVYTSTHANVYTFIISLCSLTISIATSCSMDPYRYKCWLLTWVSPTTDLGYLGVSSVTAATAVSIVSYNVMIQ